MKGNCPGCHGHTEGGNFPAPRHVSRPRGLTPVRRAEFTRASHAPGQVSHLCFTCPSFHLPFTTPFCRHGAVIITSAKRANVNGSSESISSTTSAPLLLCHPQGKPGLMAHPSKGSRNPTLCGGPLEGMNSNAGRVLTHMSGLEMSAAGSQPEATQAVESPKPSSDGGSTSKEPRRKRRKLSPDREERARPPVSIRPAPVTAPAWTLGASPQPPSTFRGKPKPILTSKRSSAVNLKNRPTHPHPAGIAIWILQKIEQTRRDRQDFPQGPAASFQTQWSGMPPQSAYPTNSPYRPPDSDRIPPSLPTQRTTPYNLQQVAEEVEEMRLQSQRDRKTKQRSENWVKSKSLEGVMSTTFPTNGRLHR